MHIVIMFQEYTDVPIVVEFKASALTDSQSESSVAMGEVDGDEDICLQSSIITTCHLKSSLGVQYVTDGVECIDDLSITPHMGRVYAVLADAPEGYYLITCKAIFKGACSGVYLKNTVGGDPERVYFYETKERDTFQVESFIAELGSCEVMATDKLKIVSLLKEELNSVILTVNECN